MVVPDIGDPSIGNVTAASQRLFIGRKRARESVIFNTGGTVGKADMVGLNDGGNEGTADGRSENEGTRLGISDCDGACENVGSIFGEMDGVSVPPLFGAGEKVGAGEMVGKTEVVGSNDGRIVGRTDGWMEVLGACVSVDGLRLVVGAILGFGLLLGAFESVGSNVSTLVGTLLIVGGGLTDGGTLGGMVDEGVKDGEPDGIAVASIPEVGKRVGTGEIVGSCEIVGCAAIVGCPETVGSSVSSGSASVGEELGKMDSMACDGAVDGAFVSATAGGHGNTLGKPLGEG